MARANTFEMEKITGYMGQKPCIICGEKQGYRAFFYPTFMNGDAEWLGDYCEAHKGTNLRDVCAGKVTLRYLLPEYPNLPVAVGDPIPAPKTER